VALANDLLDLARQLCPSGPGRPSHASLRRCISTAYYAAFHALGDEVARPYRDAVRPKAHRLLDHGQASDVLDKLRSGNATIPWITGSPPCHQELRAFAHSFVDLQMARYRADYDVEYTPTKKDAIIAVQRAERAVDALAKARSACLDQLQAVCVAVIATNQARRRMRP
jgi:DNA-directed RNA polymerase subunit H (RpoH/RPB5)